MYEIYQLGVVINVKILELLSMLKSRNIVAIINVGSGGEQLFVTLQKVDDNSTLVTEETKNVFVGGA